MAVVGTEGETMAKKSKLTQVAVKIGTAVGKADRKAHQFAKAGALAKNELEEISKQVDATRSKRCPDRTSIS